MYNLIIMSKIKNRDLYLKKLIAFKDQPVIKVITGMRRSGKSSLLLLFAEYLKEQGVREEDIVHMNFESMLFDELDDYRKLYQHIQEKIKGRGRAYLLLERWILSLSALTGRGTISYRQAHWTRRRANASYAR